MDSKIWLNSQKLPVPDVSTVVPLPHLILSEGFVTVFKFLLQQVFLRLPAGTVISFICVCQLN